MRHNTMSLCVEHRSLPPLTEQPGFVLHKIPIPPSLNNLFANAPVCPQQNKGNRGRTLTERYRTWRNAAGWIVNTQRVIRVRGPVKLRLVIEDGASRADLDNLAKPLIDLIVAHQLIDGDDYHTVRRIELEWGLVEGCQIRVEPARGA